MGGGTPDVFKEGRRSSSRPGATRAARARRGRWRSPTSRSATRPRRTPNGYLKDYYEWLGEYAQGIADSAAKDADTVKGYIQAFEEAGCDELFLIPASSDPDQVDLLAEAAL